MHWLERAAAEGTPLIDGNTATFVYHGPGTPRVIGDFTGWVWGTPALMERVGPDVWIYAHTLDLDSYIEYGIQVDGVGVGDRFNPRTVSNGIDEGTNRWFAMPAATPTDLHELRPGVPEGTISIHTINHMRTIATAERTLYLYQPPVSEPVPLVVVLDGGEFLKRAHLTTIIDNLIAQQRMQPIALAMIDNGAMARFVEYMCSDATLGLLTRSVIPQAQQHLNLIDLKGNPGAFGVMGASMGGLMSLYAALRAPDTFGRVISLSGAFGFEIDGRQTVIWELMRLLPTRPIRLWMNTGRYEWLLGVNRDMRAALIEKGYDPLYSEYSGGHNYTCWRDTVADALVKMFPPMLQAG